MTSLLDLMGKEYALSAAEARKAAAKYPVPKRGGYAAPPGTGPDGETCGSCKHIFRTSRYRKCEKRKSAWSHGFATDVFARSPACKFWEKPAQ